MLKASVDEQMQKEEVVLSEVSVLEKSSEDRDATTNSLEERLEKEKQRWENVEATEAQGHEKELEKKCSCSTNNCVPKRQSLTREAT